MTSNIETVFRWKCPLTACNSEQSGLYGDEQQTQTEFTKHLEKHSPGDFVAYMLQGKWRTRYTLMGTE